MNPNGNDSRPSSCGLQDDAAAIKPTTSDKADHHRSGVAPFRARPYHKDGEYRPGRRRIAPDCRCVSSAHGPASSHAPTSCFLLKENTHEQLRVPDIRPFSTSTGSKALRDCCQETARLPGGLPGCKSQVGSFARRRTTRMASRAPSLFSMMPYSAIGSLERDDFSANRHLALAYCWSMIFSENRYALSGSCSRH